MMGRKCGDFGSMSAPAISCFAFLLCDPIAGRAPSKGEINMKSGMYDTTKSRTLGSDVLLGKLCHAAYFLEYEARYTYQPPAVAHSGWESYHD